MKIKIDKILKCGDAEKALSACALSFDENMALTYMAEDFERYRKVSRKQIQNVNDEFGFKDEKGKLVYNDTGQLVYTDVTQALFQINAIVNREIEYDIDKIDVTVLKKATFSKKILDDLDFLFLFPKRKKVKLDIPKGFEEDEKPKIPKNNNKKTINHHTV